MHEQENAIRPAQNRQEQVSVVVCSYQGAAWLRAQLDSILEQTHRPHQIIIADDNSSDGSADIAAAFAVDAVALGVDVLLLRHPANLGFVGNFAAALARATGDIVFLSDQDDLWARTRIATYLARFAAAPATRLLHSDARLVDASGTPLGLGLFDANRVHAAELRRIRDGAALEVLVVRNVVTGATCALRRTLLQDGGLPIGDGWVHDEWLALVSAVHGGMDVIEEQTIDYRQHGGNQIGARRLGVLQQMRRMTVLQPRRRAVAGVRLQALLTLLDRQRPASIPPRWQGAAALAWAMACWRVSLYRQPDVGMGWLARDLPRLLVRIAGVCWLGGRPVRSLMAAVAGTLAGARSGSAAHGGAGSPAGGQAGVKAGRERPRD